MVFPFVILAQVSSAANGSPSRGWMMGSVGLLLLASVIIASAIWIWMLADCLLSKRPTPQKIGWVLVILFLHLIGAVLYFFTARNPRPTV